MGLVRGPYNSTKGNRAYPPKIQRKKIMNDILTDEHLACIKDRAHVAWRKYQVIGQELNQDEQDIANLLRHIDPAGTILIEIEEAHEHYQPQIDDLMAENNSVRAALHWVMEDFCFIHTGAAFDSELDKPTGVAETLEYERLALLTRLYPKKNTQKADELYGGKLRLGCGCIDICTNQRDHQKALSEPFSLDAYKHSHKPNETCDKCALMGEIQRLQHELNEINGTPEARFHGILAQMQMRFPDPESISAQAYEGRFFTWLDALLAVRRTYTIAQVDEMINDAQNDAQRVAIFNERRRIIEWLQKDMQATGWM